MPRSSAEGDMSALYHNQEFGMGLTSALIGWRLPLTPMACGKGEVTGLLPAFQNKVLPVRQVRGCLLGDQGLGSWPVDVQSRAAPQLQSLKVTELPCRSPTGRRMLSQQDRKNDCFMAFRRGPN
jgi:hypothetical protein